ncbi:MAG: hypothetical protein ACREHG_01420, partial [Candidatus Saccharimonadales bacterium]
DKVAAIPPYSIYHVTYKAGDIKRNFYPFPTRREDKRVLYPPKVCGWYWQAEVLAAIQYLEPNDTLIIHQAVSFAPHCDHIPYDFIPELASHKQALKAEHHDGYRVLKLAMNSLYGKHAQRVGANVLHTPPTYHQLGWAGYITSTIRARIYRLAMANPESVIAFETDGIYSTTRLVDGESDSGELGSWDVTEYPSGITYVQSGIYWVGGNAKYRGLDKGTLTEDMVLNAWANGDSTITGQTTRFRTMRTSLLSDYRWDDWRKWVTESRELTLEPRGKRIHVTTECRSCLGSENMSTLHDTWAVGGDGEMSVAHSLPWLTDEPDTDDYAGDDDSDLETWEC